MAIRYKGDLNQLLGDLERHGYRVQSVTHVAGAPGRSADVLLENGVTVRWDVHTQVVWADGPLRQTRRVENYLHTIYEGGLVGRIYAAGISKVFSAVSRSRPIQARPAM